MPYTKLQLKNGDELNESHLNHIEDGILNATISNKCIYKTGTKIESSTEELMIYIPSKSGYINYNFVHSKLTSKNCDMWRLAYVNSVNDNLEVIKQLTSEGAEWEMAIKIEGRPDFIGGFAHGSEIFQNILFFLDGKYVDITTVNSITNFNELKIIINSIGYDPLDETTVALYHDKEYIINNNGITLNQKVKWAMDAKLNGGTYLAMMPPYKYTPGNKDDIISNFIYSDTEYEEFEIPQSSAYKTYPKAKKVTVYSKENGYSFTLGIPKYPELSTGNKFLLQDNGGQNYNKMYFVLSMTDSVKSGDVWSTTTIYNIQG